MSTDMDLSPGRGELARYLDDELPTQERERLERALASDPGLAATFDRLREASEAVSKLFDAEDLAALPSLPDFEAFGRRRRHRLAAAAAVILLGAGLVGVSPAGASLVQGLRAVAAWITGSPEAASPPRGDDPAPGTVTITAPGGGSAFRVRLEAPLPGGRLVVERQDGQARDGRIRAVAAPSVELLFLRGELVVRSEADGTISAEPGEPSVLLTLQVPPDVTAVRVVRPDGAVQELAVREGRASVMEWVPSNR